MGLIAGNVAFNYAHTGETLHISGGTITGNIAYADGGELFIISGANFYIGTKAAIFDNWPEDIFYGYMMRFRNEDQEELPP